jgi:hypothetical protein
VSIRLDGSADGKIVASCGGGFAVLEHAARPAANNAPVFTWSRDQGTGGPWQFG